MSTAAGTEHPAAGLPRSASTGDADSSSQWLPQATATVSEGCGSEVSELGSIRCSRALAIDCGGTRCKIVCFQRDFAREDLPPYAITDEGPQLPILENSDDPSNVLKYLTLPTKRLGDWLAWCRKNGVVSHYCAATADVVATGGGAFKFQEALKEQLGVTLRPLSEMQTLVDGMNLLLTKAPRGEVFNYDWERKKKVYPSGIASRTRYPYLITSIGSGVSIIKVTGPGEWCRVSGSCIGGGTFWGLSKLLTDVKSWEELEDVRQGEGNCGDNREVDLLVGDIYGSRGMTTLGLSEHVIASSFGKAGLVGSDEEEVVEAPPPLPTDLPSSFDSNACLRLPLSPRSGLRRSSTAVDKATAASGPHSPLHYLHDIRRLGSEECAPSPYARAAAGGAARRRSTPFDSESEADSAAPSSPFATARAGSASGADKPRDGSVHPLPCGVTARRKRYRRTRPSAANLLALDSLHCGAPSPSHAYRAPDICRSLLLMVANNIGQITYLNAKMHGVENVYFTGGFTHDNPYVWSKLSYAIHFWSKGEMKASFLTHDGYLGALGALIHKDEE